MLKCQRNQRKLCLYDGGKKQNPRRYRIFNLPINCIFQSKSADLDFQYPAIFPADSEQKPGCRYTVCCVCRSQASESRLSSIPAGIYRHHFVQNPKEDAHGDTQALPDPPHPPLLHAEGEVHAAELPRPAHADPHRLPQTRRKAPPFKRSGCWRRASIIPWFCFSMCVSRTSTRSMLI